MNTAHWTTYIPETQGHLPNGKPIPRTEPGGSFGARIALLGLYPAASVSRMMVNGSWMNLPVRVERTSFENSVSASADELDKHYLKPLNITRSDVLMLDLMPFFLLNTRMSNSRSMAGNIEAYEDANNVKLGIHVRPAPKNLVELARSMPGNVARLHDYLTRSDATLLLTLGSETAAFARGVNFTAVSGREKEIFYRPPVMMSVAGVDITVIHLAHPGLLMTPAARVSGWLARHQDWCGNLGLSNVRTALSDRL
jgi:hypothetical protein